MSSSLSRKWKIEVPLAIDALTLDGRSSQVAGVPRDRCSDDDFELLWPRLDARAKVVSSTACSGSNGLLLNCLLVNYLGTYLSTTCSPSACSSTTCSSTA